MVSTTIAAPASTYPKFFKSPAAEAAHSESVNALAKLDIKAVRELKAV